MSIFILHTVSFHKTMKTISSPTQQSTNQPFNKTSKSKFDTSNNHTDTQRPQLRSQIVISTNNRITNTTGRLQGLSKFNYPAEKHLQPHNIRSSAALRTQIVTRYKMSRISSKISDDLEAHLGASTCLFLGKQVLFASFSIFVNAATLD